MTTKKVSGTGWRKRGRTSGRPSAADAAKLNEHLLDAAFALFSKEGYGATTMERIAKAAGASTRTLYSRYDNKLQILGATIDRIIAESLAEHAAGTAVDPHGYDPSRFLTSFGREVVMRIQTQGLGLNRLVCAEGHRYPEVAKFFSQEKEPGVKTIQTALEMWHSQGLLPLLDDARMSAVLLFTMMVDRPRLQAVVGAPLTQKELDAHLEAAVLLFLRGCGYVRAIPKGKSAPSQR